MADVREALYIGINEYDHRPSLCACEADARAMAEALEVEFGGKSNWTPVASSLLVGARATESELMTRVENLLQSGAYDHGDALLYFSGHADRFDDDLLLAAVDDDPSDPDSRRGLRFSRLVRFIRDAQGIGSVTIILDCCHAGAIKNIDIPVNVTVLAAARDNQQAIESNGRGRFTGILLAGLNGESVGSADLFGGVTAVSLYTDANAMLNYRRDRQQPMLKACLEKIIVLKHVRPSLDIQCLRRLGGDDPRPGRGRIFDRADAAFEAYPEMEAPNADRGEYRTGDEREQDLTDSQRLMNDFKYWRNVHLIELYDEYGEPSDDLFFVCLHRGTILLTSRGRYYWNLVTQGRL
ncbi:hypothetical protein EP30_10150 [Bifidobacterium sp. UTCIF-39]|uniref:caspase family protein n=1 Tax=Bifidobacterium sp. UTCIF-39 TaxID=1465359 RepID=UPI0015E44AF0|nr:caspase family protein [Bifidobacterium sp. UTCIF-39]TPF95877.1 hypothetical protein EP30_10150 [Bifidobacterium sp. UTCIF-39]